MSVNEITGIDWTDRRPLEEIPLGLTVLEVEREDVAKWTRSSLAACGVKIAQDISKLGCTGLAAHNIADKQTVRNGLGGSGCILPCFVPPTRFCLVHNTIGGLQDGQIPEYPEMIEAVSRELNDKEKKHVKVIEAAQRVKDRTGKLDNRIRDAMDILKTEEGDEDDEDAKAEVAAAAAETATVTGVRYPPSAENWKCQEHGETFWACRFCVAAEIVKGDFEPQLMLSVPLTPPPEASPSIAFHSYDKIAAGDVEETVSGLPHAEAELYVRVARWRRKLARD